ncbi:MAG: hypothetical protein WC822_06750 [Candidatus Paceibacterota bacterium]
MVSSVPGLQFAIDYATDGNSIGDSANFAAYALDKWLFVAATNDGTNAPKLYMGSLTEPLAEPSSYRTAIAPVGARGDDSANTLFIGNGNSPTFNQGFPGRIGLYGIVPAVMTLPELVQQQFSRVPIRSDYLLFANLGFGAVNSVDWSGLARAGSVTGATLADHVPQGTFTGYEASYPSTTTEIAAIADGTHDGHEYPQDTWNTGDVWFGHYGTSDEWACLHFQSVDIPKNATIESATLRLREHTHEGGSYTVNAKVRAQLIANASPPGAANLPSDMTLTTAGTDLDVLTDNWVDTEITDVDVKTSVQEVINQASWAANNALNIVIENDGTTGDQDVDVYSYDILAGYAAMLTIVYSLPEPAAAVAVLKNPIHWTHAYLRM